MKKTALALTAAIAIMMASCGGQNADKGASSTPIDSTNLNGTAPANYDAQDPAMKDSARNQGSHDEGLRANTASSEDSAKMRQ